VAARDVRYLLDRGYPSRSAIRFVGDHYRLPEEKRFVLARVLVPKKVARSRQEKLVSLGSLSGQDLAIDGYNVLITTESLLSGEPVYRCDDGFLRDTRGIFRKYKTSKVTKQALELIFGLVKEGESSSVLVLLDKQISKSGTLAAYMRKTMADFEISGNAKTAPDVDRRLKLSDAVIATGDGSIIDSRDRVVDIPAEVAKRMEIGVIVL